MDGLLLSGTDECRIAATLDTCSQCQRDDIEYLIRRLTVERSSQMPGGESGIHPQLHPIPPAQVTPDPTQRRILEQEPPPGPGEVGGGNDRPLGDRPAVGPYRTPVPGLQYHPGLFLVGSGCRL